jgi:hypothetical protein
MMAQQWGRNMSSLWPDDGPAVGPKHVVLPIRGFLTKTVVLWPSHSHSNCFLTQRGCHTLKKISFTVHSSENSRQTAYSINYAVNEHMKTYVLPLNISFVLCNLVKIWTCSRHLSASVSNLTKVIPSYLQILIIERRIHLKVDKVQWKAKFWDQRCFGIYAA